MKFPGQRLTLLFEMLQNETLPPQELARRLAVSTRTLRTDVRQLNQLLNSYGARCQLIPRTGYQLQIDDTVRFSQFDRVRLPDKVPRSPAARVDYLLHRFLTARGSLKLNDLAEECFISRATLQSEMAEVRKIFSRYPLTMTTRPRYGMKLSGSEVAIRSCLSDFYHQQLLPENATSLFTPTLQSSVSELLHQCFSQFNIRMSDDNFLYLQLYCSIVQNRIAAGWVLHQFTAEGVAEEVLKAAQQIMIQLQPGKDPVSEAEVACLGVNIAARRSEEHCIRHGLSDDSSRLMEAMLHYINQQYNFDLRNDLQLRSDLLTHIHTMLTRARYQINIPNPLLVDIKQYYPLAYEITLAAVSECTQHIPLRISENEIGFLVLHIGVGLERYAPSARRYQPQVLLVCDAGTSTVRVLQAQLLRKYPQIVITNTLTLREYVEQPSVSEDFVVSTVRLQGKQKPVVLVSPFPSDYQWEMVGRQVFASRSGSGMLSRFFDARHFMIVDPPVTREELFRRICDQLQQENIVDEHFCGSVNHREQIVSTLLGEGIALPHSLGLQASQSVVYTVLAPGGIPWGEERAYVIFLLAISKAEYQATMGIYDIFVALMQSKAAVQLKNCPTFPGFIRTALQFLRQSAREG